MATLTLALTDAMAERLTRPMLDGWHIVFPFDVHYTICDLCGSGSKFIRVQADDCDVWGLRGIDGAHSDVYGIYCHVHD